MGRWMYTNLFYVPLTPTGTYPSGLPSGHSSSYLHNSPLGGLTGIQTHNGQNCSPHLPLNLNSSLLRLAKWMTIHPSAKPETWSAIFNTTSISPSFHNQLPNSLAYLSYRKSDSFLLPTLSTSQFRPPASLLITDRNVSPRPAKPVSPTAVPGSF